MVVVVMYWNCMLTHLKHARKFILTELKRAVMNKKKQIRNDFRETCFIRDKHLCVMCKKLAVDCHHITDRGLVVNGGSLCSNCHMLAEIFHSTGTAYAGYSPEDLYNKIGSSYEKAVEASEKL